jgi:hypothetical protein
MLAIAAVGCDRKDEALARLARAADERDMILATTVKYWPDLEPIRGSAGYRAVLARMGWG